MYSIKKDQIIMLFFRIGIFSTFFGHGYLALTKNKAWIPYLEVVGFSYEQALYLLPFIGVLDLLVAFFILIRPNKFVLIWAVIWTFSTALIRPISGESIFAFIERGANWILPLIFLLIYSEFNNLKI